MSEKGKKKYEVTILSKWGICDRPLFEKMLKNGDVQSESVKDCIGKFIKIKGYAKVNIDTDDKNFELVYYATDDGYISSGSEVFFNSVSDYIDETEVEKFKIVSVKTSKGNTYKATPILKEEIEDEIIDEL